MDEPQDNELESAAEDLDTDQILALVAEEEERCLVLENEVEEMKHHQQEEEDLLRKQQEWEEAIRRLHVVRSKRATLESLLLVSPPTASSLQTLAGATQAPRGLPPRATGRQGRPSTALGPALVTMVWQASTSWTDRQEEDAIPVSTAPGEFASNDFARQLLASVKQLKEGDLGPFSRLMTEAMRKSEIKKSESLPNVHFNEGPIIGSAIC